VWAEQHQESGTDEIRSPCQNDDVIVHSFQYILAGFVKEEAL